MNPWCNKCYWRDQCTAEAACEDYFPAGEEFSDSLETISDIKDRLRFRSDWNDYLEERSYYC